jgi:hypothetical protein
VKANAPPPDASRHRRQDRYGLGTNVGIKRVADGVAAAAVDPVLADTELAGDVHDGVRGRLDDRGACSAT